MAQIDVICDVLNDEFLDRPFQLPELLEALEDTGVSLSMVSQTIHHGITNGFIVPEFPGRLGPRRKNYLLQIPIIAARIKRSTTIMTNKVLGRTPADMFTDENHPSKRMITNDFYTTFSVYCNTTKSILALCGPNTDRFISNVHRITTPSIGNVTLVECNENVAADIKKNLDAYSKHNPFPKYTMENVRLEDFLGSGFYQFQELDCEGNWDLLYNTYEERLNEQALDNEVVKGMIITTFCKYENVDKLNDYFSPLLSNIGASFSNNKVLDISIRKRLRGNWKYVHLYDTFPHCTSMGRIGKLLIYKYAQKGAQMITALIVYK